MPVHALECGGKDTLFGRGNQEVESVHAHQNSALDEAPRQQEMLSGLSQPSYVRLDRLRQSRQGEVPLVGQPVAPAAGCYLRAERTGKDLQNGSAVARGNQVKVVA